MAITGTFVADFTSFNTAVQNAGTKLRTFEGDAGKVGTALSKMTDSFSGRKIIDDASSMVTAVERIGGTSKLTASELQRISTTAAEAAAKMKAMGIDVPPGLQKIADEAKNVDTTHRTLGSTVKDLALGFAAMFTARAAFNFVKDSINEASALKDLGQQTHINVEELQLLAGAMSEFGVDADTLGKGLFTLSRKIAGDDASVANGLHMMGLSMREVKGLEGQALFLKIESGLATLQGSLRDTAASELFGSRLGMAMAGASEGIVQTLEDTKRLSTVMSTEAVDAADKFGESIERANRSLKSMSLNMMGPVAEGFNTLFDVAEKGASTWSILWAAMADAFASQTTGVSSGTALARVLDDLNQQTEVNSKATVGAAAAGRERVVVLTAEQQAVKFMAALEADAAATLDPAQIKNLKHLKEIGALNAQNASAIGVNAAQFAKYVADVAAAEKETKEFAESQTRLVTIFKEWNATTLYRSIDLTRQYTAELVKSTTATGALVLAELNAQIKLNAARGLDAVGSIKLQTTALDTLRIGQEALVKTADKNMSQTAQQQVLMDEYTQALYDDAVAQDKAALAAVGINTELAKTVPLLSASAQAANAAASGFNTFTGAVAASYQALGGLAQSTQLTYAMAGITQLSYSLAGIMPQRRASGGPVSGGMPYMVGERGPELFVPSSSGSIRANGSGGGITVPITVQGSVFGSKQELARAVNEAVTSALRSSGVRMPTGA